MSVDQPWLKSAQDQIECVSASRLLLIPFPLEVTGGCVYSLERRPGPVTESVYAHVTFIMGIQCLAGCLQLQVVGYRM